MITRAVHICMEIFKVLLLYALKVRIKELYEVYETIFLKLILIF